MCTACVLAGCDNPHPPLPYTIQSRPSTVIQHNASERHGRGGMIGDGSCHDQVDCASDDRARLMHHQRDRHRRHRRWGGCSGRPRHAAARAAGSQQGREAAGKHERDALELVARRPSAHARQLIFSRAVSLPRHYCRGDFAEWSGLRGSLHSAPLPAHGKGAGGLGHLAAGWRGSPPPRRTRSASARATASPRTPPSSWSKMRRAMAMVAA
jgi:hypothetical protein